MNMDFDDTIRIRKLVHSFNEMTLKANAAVRKWMTAEMQLDKALILNKIKNSSAWSKQIIELISIKPEYDALHSDYHIGRLEEKCAINALKAIEMEVNALKKIYDETPK